MEKLSIISPVYNEEKYLPCFFSQQKKNGANEVICIDGGSSDQTLKQLKFWADASLDASQDGCSRIVISSGKGRALQMNAGAKQASGEIFIFLHVDSALPSNGIRLLQKAMADAEVVGGAFLLKIDSTRWFLKWITLMANLRSKYWGLPYGDQGYFVRRTVFEDMGGYRNMALMEDVDFFRRLKKEGKTVLLKQPVLTSARRWQKKGFYLNSLRNALFLALYFIGFSPKRLGSWYYSSN